MNIDVTTFWSAAGIEHTHETVADREARSRADTLRELAGDQAVVADRRRESRIGPHALQQHPGRDAAPIRASVTMAVRWVSFSSWYGNIGLRFLFCSLCEPSATAGGERP